MSSLCLRLSYPSSRSVFLSHHSNSSNLWRFSRKLHNRRQLKYPIEAGLGDFLTPEALQTIAVDYQDGLLERLNDEVRGTEHENQSIAQTVISTSYDPSKTLAFNYASLALNNSFFLDYLKPPLPESGNHEAHITPYLGGAIGRHHGGLDQLKSTFSAAALGMVGSGYIWFVSDGKGATAVLPTFCAGTLLIRARTQAVNNPGAILGEDQDVWEHATVGNAHPRNFRGTSPLTTANSSTVEDLFNSQSTLSRSKFNATNTSPTSGVSSHQSPLDPSTPSRSFHSIPARCYDHITTPPPGLHSQPLDTEYYHNLTADETHIPKRGDVLHPLFCVSVHEHAWMSAGYGVWGKEEYLKRFWSCLDWGSVSAAYATFVRDPSQKF